MKRKVSSSWTPERPEGGHEVGRAWGLQQGFEFYSKGGGVGGHQDTKGSGGHLHRGGQMIGRNLDSEVKKACFTRFSPSAVNVMFLSV